MLYSFFQTWIRLSDARNSYEGQNSLTVPGSSMNGRSVHLSSHFDLMLSGFFTSCVGFKFYFFNFIYDDLRQILRLPHLIERLFSQIRYNFILNLHIWNETFEIECTYFSLKKERKFLNTVCYWIYCMWSYSTSHLISNMLDNLFTLKDFLSDFHVIFKIFNCYFLDIFLHGIFYCQKIILLVLHPKNWKSCKKKQSSVFNSSFLVKHKWMNSWYTVWIKYIYGKNILNSRFFTLTI